MIPRRWIRKQLDEEFRRGYKGGLLNGAESVIKQRKGKWTKGHLVIGFVKGEQAEEMLRAQDELVAFVNSLKSVRCKAIGVDIAAKEVFMELATSGGLEELLAEMERACPSLKDGSASAGRFVRRFE